MIPYLPKPTRIHTGRLFDRLLANEQWVVEPKLDGVRCLVVVNDEGIKAYTHNGQLRRILPWLDELDLEPGMYDCELVGDTLHCFDRPDIQRSYLDRRHWIPLMRPHFQCVDLLDKTPDVLEKALASGAEGLVFKNVDSPYPMVPGPCQKTFAWFKVKP